MMKERRNLQKNFAGTYPGTKKYVFPDGIIVGIAGCSAVGKSTVIDRVSEMSNASQAYSVATRALRGPDDKRIPVSMEEYLRMRNSGELIEGVIYDGHGYGISKAAVSEILSRGQIALIDCNESGMKQLLKTDLAPTVITFFLVSSAQELFHRQLTRGAGTEDSRRYRLQSSITEIEGAKKPEVFQFVVRNGNVDDAARKIIRIIEGLEDESDYFNVEEFKNEMTALIATL